MEDVEIAKIKLIQSATDCTFEEAELAWQTSDGNESDAIEVLAMIRPRFLVIKVHFSGSGMKTLEGLAAVIIEEDSHEPVFTSAVVINYSEEPLVIDSDASINFWHQYITSLRTEQNRFNIESSVELHDFIKSEITPEPYYTVRKTTIELRELESSDDSEEIELRCLDLNKILNTTMLSFFERFFSQPLNIEISYEFQNQYRFDEIAKNLGIKIVEEEKKEKSEKNDAEKQSYRASVVKLQGKIVLDIVDGILAGDLKIDDKIAVDVVENSRVAENIGKLLGLKSQGQWLHAWGLIVEIDELTDGRRRMLTRIAKNIYVESIAMNNVKVKSTRKYPGGDRKEYILESPTTVPGYLMVAGMALFLTLLFKIFIVVTH